MKHLGRKIAIPLVGLGLAGSGFALLANNTVAASYAGQGTNTISGYRVSTIHYQYSTVDQTSRGNFIATVTFTLDHAATSVSAVVKEGYTYHYNKCVMDSTTAADPFISGNFPANTFTCYTNYDGPAVTPTSAGPLIGASTLNAAPVGGTNTLTVAAAE